MVLTLAQKSKLGLKKTFPPLYLKAMMLQEILEEKLKPLLPVRD